MTDESEKVIRNVANRWSGLFVSAVFFAIFLGLDLPRVWSRPGTFDGDFAIQPWEFVAATSLALASFGALRLFWHPKVVVHTRHIEVQNPLCTSIVPVQLVRRLDTSPRYPVLHFSGGRVSLIGAEKSPLMRLTGRNRNERALFRALTEAKPSPSRDQVSKRLAGPVGPLEWGFLFIWLVGLGIMIVHYVTQ